MSEKSVTRHQCPVCKGIIFNNVVTFHDHLNNICCNTLFSKYPGLKTAVFNALWYKLDAMVKEKLIIPSGQKGIHSLIHHSQHAPPQQQQYYKYGHHHQQQRIGANNNNNGNGKGNDNTINGIDLEDIDRDIEYLQRTERERERNRIQQRKRRRHEMEQEISTEINNDRFNLSMPKLNDNETNKNKKRRLLYHNTSDIRPPKRVNIDPSINMQLFQHKIRQTQREYHNVSYEDFTSNDNQNVDQNAAIIHTQNALHRYLLQCGMLRKCFNGELFAKIAGKEEKVFANNYENIMIATLNEIKVWQNFDGEVGEMDMENKENKIELEKEKFLSSWDAIKQQTSQHHLEKLLERDNLCGFYAKIDQNAVNENDSDKRHSFWNASNNVKYVGYHESIFDNAQNKKFIKL